MKIIEVKTLEIPEIKIIRFSRFCDQRGYFTEQFKKSDFLKLPELDFLEGVEFIQANESYSRKGVVRGLHFQWNPYQGKLVRTLRGRMVDLVLDIRKGSPAFGKIIAYDMSSSPDKDYGEWIWIPPGFAHGNFFTKETAIEYFCTSEYNPECEAGISPLAKDIDWSLCDSKHKEEFDTIIKDKGLLISDKDRNGFSVKAWENDKRSDNFTIANA